MECYVNKQKITYHVARSLFDILQEYNYHTQKGIAVAVNDEVVTKNEWKDTRIKDHDRITIIQATQGG